MSLILSILSRMFRYAVIIGIVSFVTTRLHPKDSAGKKEKISLEIDQMGYARFFLVAGIVLMMILVIVGSLPSNVSGDEKHIVAAIAISFTILVYVLALYCYFDKWRIDENGIYIKKGFFRGKCYRLEEIKSYEVNQENRLIVNLINGKKVKILPSDENRIFKEDVIEKLKAFHIPLEKSEKDEIVVKRLKAEMGLSIFLASGCFVLLLFTIHIIWFSFLLICAIIFEIEEALTILIDRIVICKDTIQVVKLFKRTKYIRDFDMKNKKIKKVENGYWVYVYGEKKLLFKYSSAYTNVKQIDHRLRNIPIKKDEAAK